MTARQEAITKLVRKVIDDINSLPVSAPPNTSALRIIMQAQEDLETVIRLLDLVQCDIKAQADKL